MKEEELIARVIVFNDFKAFEILMKRYDPDLRNFLFKVSKAEDYELDDLSQEVYIKVFKYLKSFNAKSKFSTWLYRIAYNVFLDYCKTHKKVQPEGLVSTTGTKGSPLLQTEMKMDAAIMLDALKEVERACFDLYYLRDFSQAEVAEILGLPLGTVKSHLRRGRLKLTQLFKKTS